MSDHTHDDLTPIEERLRSLLSRSLLDAERDFQPPATRRVRVNPRVTIAAAAIAMPVVLVAVIAFAGRMLLSVPTAATPNAPGRLGSGPPQVDDSAGTTVWPGRVVAAFDAPADTLTYDVARGVIWIPVNRPAGPATLYKYDPATGAVAQWALPEASYRGDLAQAVVDGVGAVWISADGYRLVRFDPNASSVETFLFPVQEPGVDSTNGGTWISAIAVDGDGVLVARNQISRLVRLGPALTITGTIEISEEFAGATGLAVVGNHLFLTAGGPPATIARLSMAGQVEARFAINADRLFPFGDNIIASNQLTRPTIPDEVVRPDGSLLRTLPPPFTFPVVTGHVSNPLGVEVPVSTVVAPQAMTGDGQRRTWFIVGGDPTLHEFIASP